MELDQVSATFRFSPEDSLKDISKKIVTNRTIGSFLFQSKGVDVTITAQENTRTNEKLRMFAYLNGVLIPAVIKAKKSTGEIVDKAECMIQMKMLFAKDVRDKDGDQVLILLSQSDMSKTRLTEFITDIVFHLESEYGIQAPDSEQWKLERLNSLKNKNFKKV